MEKEKLKEISVYIVFDDKGKIWKESARLTHDQCRDNFVKEWMFRIKDHIDSHTCWQVWGCFERAGFKIEEIKFNNL